MVWNSLVEKCRSRTRGQWEGLVSSAWTDVRIWVQENGEKAALVSLVLGVIVVLFFKLVLIIGAILVLIWLAVWNLAPEDSSAGSISQSNSGQNGPGADQH